MRPQGPQRHDETMTENAIVPITESLPVLSDPTRLRTLLANSLDGGEGGIRWLDLPQFNADKSGMWMETDAASDESTPVQSVEGMVVHRQVRRKLYLAASDEGGMPDCRSEDCINAYGTIEPGGEQGPRKCAGCPMAEFGSDVSDDGKPRKGQRCKQESLLFVLRTDLPGNFPVVLHVTAGSLKVLRSYSTLLQGKDVDPQGSVHRFTVAKAKGEFPYGQLRCALVRPLEQKEIDALGVYVADLKAALAAQQAQRRADAEEGEDAF